jgi:hypothetical protein
VGEGGNVATTLRGAAIPMDVKSFADELLRALADTGLFQRVALRTEGPIADGQADVREELFLRFYFNEDTGTIAFALIEK